MALLPKGGQGSRRRLGVDIGGGKMVLVQLDYLSAIQSVSGCLPLSLLCFLACAFGCDNFYGGVVGICRIPNSDPGQVFADVMHS